MISNKLIIYENDVLFEVLDEIKEKLNFDLIKANKKDFDLIKKNLKTNFLVITSVQKDHVNCLIIKEFPIKLKKLIQTININLLKTEFNNKSNVNVGSYKLNLNSREIIRNQKILGLTEREINLINFISKSKNPVKIDELQKEVWDYSDESETHTVETHIYRLRKKIKEKFNDDNFIVSSKNGYIIN